MDLVDWDHLPGVMDSGMTHEYAMHYTVHRFLRVTRPDELEPIFYEDDESLRCRAPRRQRDGEVRDESGDGDGYGGDAGDHGAGDDDGGDGGDDDGGDGRAVAVTGTGTPGASSSRSARDVYTDWMA